MDPDQIGSEVSGALTDTPILDMHTHLFPPSFGAQSLWGIDELLRYHYLEAELFRSSPVTPPQYFAMTTCEQADLIWRTLFVEHAPASDATRGVVYVLHRFGLRTDAPDLKEAREYFHAQDPEAHVRRVFELAGVREIVMTNDPLDPAEAPYWLDGAPRPPEFMPALRLDRILNRWTAHYPVLQSQGYKVEEHGKGATMKEVQRFLGGWVDRMHPRYMAVSLPYTFRYPAGDLRYYLIRDAVLPACRAADIPLSLMIGPNYQVNPEIRLAGDALGKSDIHSVETICRTHPDNRFLITMLSRENQHELCVATRKFANLMPFGCWWFLNNTSIVDEITRERIEMLGTTFIAQHSDARVLEHVIYKWRNTRRVLASVLSDTYRLLKADGRAPKAGEIRQDVHRLLRGNFERWTKPESTHERVKAGTVI